MNIKKTVVLLFAMLGLQLLYAQNTVSYVYDADGNLESRYTVTLRSSEPEEAEPETPKNVSIELDNRKITVYPNPTQGEICVEISLLNSEEENFMRVFDSSGRLLETKKIGSERTNLKISGNPGFYLLNIHLGDTVSKWKIIKQ
jgi:hypothetical protein